MNEKINDLGLLELSYSEQLLIEGGMFETIKAVWSGFMAGFAAGVRETIDSPVSNSSSGTLC